MNEKQAVTSTCNKNSANNVALWSSFYKVGMKKGNAKAYDSLSCSVNMTSESKIKIDCFKLHYNSFKG